MIGEQGKELFGDVFGVLTAVIKPRVQVSDKPSGQLQECRAASVPAKEHVQNSPVGMTEARNLRWFEV